MFGSHLSIAGGMHNALLRAEELGFETVQVFSKNQQQWRAKPLGQGDIDAWRTHAKRLGFKKTVAHDSYLINIASPDEQMWRKSLDSLIAEHQRCEALGIPYLVMHPGAHMGEGDEKGIARVSEALDEVHAVTRRAKVLTTLEVTAGQGSCLGCRLEHLAEIIEKVKEPKRMAVCLDTAHLFAAGYDFRGSKYDAFRRELARVLGSRTVKVWHLNDSKKDLGSHVDRHDHIGEGKIGLDGFEPIVNDDAWANVPKILETPKEKDAQGRDWDTVNLERLKGLIGQA